MQRAKLVAATVAALVGMPAGGALAEPAKLIMRHQPAKLERAGRNERGPIARRGREQPIPDAHRERWDREARRHAGPGLSRLRDGARGVPFRQAALTGMSDVCLLLWELP